MKHFEYRPKGVCSQLIEFDLEDNVVHNVKFTSVCNGNLKAISKFVEGMTVEEIESKVLGVNCGGRPTSCSDQLAKGLRLAADSIANDCNEK
jgi:uncharacterized protein (TIGR03905 family)